MVGGPLRERYPLSEPYALDPLVEIQTEKEGNWDYLRSVASIK